LLNYGYLHYLSQWLYDAVDERDDNHDGSTVRFICHVSDPARNLKRDDISRRVWDEGGSFDGR